MVDLFADFCELGAEVGSGSDFLTEDEEGDGVAGVGGEVLDEVLAGEGRVQTGMGAWEDSGYR